jgi:aerobic carbon-monoxide dehydrogenase large subunit
VSANGELRAGGRWLGRSARRVEDPRLVSGEARYVADLTLPRMLHACFVRSTEAHARIVAIDVAAAEALPGVHRVFVGEDLAAIAPLVDPMPFETLLKTPQPVLARERVRFVGEAVAVVVADDLYLAEDGAELVAVDYEPLPPVVDALAAMEPDAPLLFEQHGTNVMYREADAFGDVDAAFAEAAHTFSIRLHTNRCAASPMEARGAIAEHQAREGRMTVWSSTQNPHSVRAGVAAALGMSDHQVRVVVPEVGGAFGQKLSPYAEEIVIPWLARELGRPVKWIEDRRENLLAATQSKEQVVDAEAAVAADGKLLGMRARYVGDSGGYSFNATCGVLVEPQVAARLMPSVYTLENYAYEVDGVLTNKTPIGAYRGIGWTAGHTARELLFDMICRDLDLDPAEFRLRNMVAPEALPYRSCVGANYESGSFTESLQMVLDAVDYPAFRERQRALRDAGRYIGIGLSPWVEPTGYGSRIGAEMGLPGPSHDSARMSIGLSGKVTLITGFVSHGQGHETTFAQAAAEAVGVPLEDVIVLQGDTDATPFGMGTHASRGAVVGAGMISRAGEKLREKVLAIGATMLEASPADMVIEDGRVHVRGVPDSGIGLAELSQAVHFGGVTAEDGGDDPTLATSAFYDPGGTYSNGCVAVLVEVDVGTGVVRFDDVVVVEDCGTMLNPMIVEGQIAGAIAQGIGAAVLEHAAYDENGQPLATSYMDYLLPSSTDVPPIRVLHIETPSPNTIHGVKGMGESGMIATPAAVCNAILDALAPFEPGVPELPLSPDNVLRLIDT